ncbi:MAG: hypothetical protein BWY80_01218 [Firmicutes bacterium ADurb.Bin456]|nr:MAG: hypothetical protein BWY80_01218 [Firmicutes bacterium ADurb.Bin456]
MNSGFRLITDESIAFAKSRSGIPFSIIPSRAKASVLAVFIPFSSVLAIMLAYSPDMLMESSSACFMLSVRFRVIVIPVMAIKTARTTVSTSVMIFP